MPSWKTVFLRSAGFGAGFVVALCGVALLWFLYSGRPKPPKPWNKLAIVAEYDDVRPVGGKDYLNFNYMLQNNTNFDFRVDSEAGIAITAKMKQEKGFAQFAPGVVTISYPIFVPAKSRVWIALSIPYAYPVKEKEKPNREERKQYTTEVAKYVTEELPNLDGFVLFDAQNRYEIDFPAGWEKPAKEELTTK